ncbi:LysR substrate-binding domain-containing protein [Defluviimonas sp. WL0024]|uniref:LysR substrate-binding domain-containing protein n=1 Tax=Albidovulum salinarum TaxID=2984153 RepID=A0ABT2X247_9RHOB|nr:LysR substrate-binding domain-containing protein [Defluviimonas sp. WL0024]MCU9847715.1 LysR substrate-binding domain-containing protein [Defluviimonas sp. WL0024]
MQWSDLPPLNSLRAFAALAEAGSFVAAGRALGVSHGAVTQQVRALEDRLGTALVERRGRGVGLTPEGADLARSLAQGFGTIHAAVSSLAGAERQRPVEITMSPAFATCWLMPRLAGFRRRHPGIALTLIPTSEIIEPRPGGVDVAIRYAERGRAPPDATAVLVADMAAVAAPALLAGRRIARPEDLGALPWLEELGTSEVRDWMSRKGAGAARPPVSQMPGNLIIEALRRGEGVTYTALPFVAEEIRRGALVSFFADPGYGIYHIRTAEGAGRAAARTFLRWLCREAERAPLTPP